MVIRWLTPGALKEKSVFNGVYAIGSKNLCISMVKSLEQLANLQII